VNLEHSFTVPVGVDEAWKILLDVERVAPCMPGATLESVDGDDFTGNVKVKLGAINLTYKGKASFVEKDEAAHRAVIDARGRDSRGNGTAAAKVTTSLTDEGGSTKVLVNTDLDITGKVAQFGRGVMVDVGNKLIGQFADCLARTITSGNETASASAGSGGGAQAADAGGKSKSEQASPAEPAAGGASADATATAEVTAAVGASGRAAARPARTKAAREQASEPAKATKAAAKATKRARPRPTKPPADSSPPAAVLDADSAAAAPSTEPETGADAATTGAAESGTQSAAATAPDEASPTAPDIPVVDEEALAAVSEGPGYSAPSEPAEASEESATTAAPVNGRTPAAAEREVEPINLLEHAGPAIAKRAAPPAALLLLIVLFVILRRRRP
jgi:carbon monoxide dehydrogenase subunit G